LIYEAHNLFSLGPICQRVEILQLIAKLRNDNSKDVKNIIEGIIRDHNLSLENLPQESPSTDIPSASQESITNS